MHWYFLASAIAISMGGQTLLKAGAGRPDIIAQILDWRTLLGLFLYGGSSLLYIVALRNIPMSVALPCTAVSYVAAMIIGGTVFGETISATHVLAMGLISAGVVLLAVR
jgi:multidrug transporter EmrE-like cation transporter